MDPSTEASLFAPENSHSEKNPALSELNKVFTQNFIGRQDSLDLVMEVMKENVNGDSGNSLDARAMEESFDISQWQSFLGVDSNPTTPTTNFLLNTPPTSYGGSPSHNPLFINSSPYSGFASVTNSPQNVIPLFGKLPVGFTPPNNTTISESLNNTPSSQASPVPDCISYSPASGTSPVAAAPQAGDLQWPSSIELKREDSESPALPPCAVHTPQPSPTSPEQPMELNIRKKVKKEPVDVSLRPPRRYNRNRQDKSTKEYKEKRKKNNEAVRKSRFKAKMRIDDILRENATLKEQLAATIRKVDEKSDDIERLTTENRHLKDWLAKYTNSKFPQQKQTTGWPKHWKP